MLLVVLVLPINSHKLIPTKAKLHNSDLKNSMWHTHMVKTTPSVRNVVLEIRRNGDKSLFYLTGGSVLLSDHGLDGEGVEP